MTALIIKSYWSREVTLVEIYNIISLPLDPTVCTWDSRDGIIIADKKEKTGYHIQKLLK